MDMTTLLNFIRQNASADYQERIPEATKENLQEIGDIILSDVDLTNDFTSALMNKFAFTFAHNKVFKNPLAMLKKGKKPMGNTVEEIFVNFAKGEEFDPEGKSLLNRKLPDVKTIYHTRNRRNKYTVTIGVDQLRAAFRSYADLEMFVNRILGSLYNGDENDEFILFKQLLTNAIEQKYVKTVNVEDPCTSAENAKAFVKALKTVSANMEYPSTAYNGYADAQDTDTIPVRTFCKIPDQLIVIDTATDVAIDVDVLASAFNLTKQEFLARKVKIDAFPDPTIRAMVIDKDFTQIYDDLYQMKRFENGEGLYTNYFLHHWQTISASCLVNAVAFKTGVEA